MKLPFETERLIRYVKGIASEDEKKSVEGWLAEKDEHALFYNRFRQFWQRLEQPVAESPNVDEAWSNVL
ncbi:MAG: hypothetical protein MI784_11715, partial [Cytophagales bacterium]|nr:hypothetical protein [Cytophagales bacterium]